MARQFFGTDGVRGEANRVLTPELAYGLGRGAALWLKETGGVPQVVLGRDTRRSGSMIGAALAAGFCTEGVSVVSLGWAPTPAVAFVARTGDFGLGGIISASHNPAPDNGIKFVGHDGRKLPDSVEERIESLMAGSENRIGGGEVGWINSDDEALERYLQFLEALVPEGLSGLKVAVDGANGAAFRLGPEILRRLGAEVATIGIDPGDGTTINHGCGATKPGVLQTFTVETGAQVGVAFDGDADRAVFSDHLGRLINGDRTIAIWAAHEQKHGRLNPATVVGTVMSNGGFAKYMADRGITLERAPVGDKYVAQRIAETNARIGGEQSGHIIFPEQGPTGDGLVTMLQLFRVLHAEGRPAAEFYDEFQNWPQLMVNIGVKSKDGWQEAIAEELAQAEHELGERGRVNVRPSGTEAKIRVMVEADDIELRDRVAESLVEPLVAKLGGEVRGRVDLTHALGD